MKDTGIVAKSPLAAAGTGTPSPLGRRSAWRSRLWAAALAAGGFGATLVGASAYVALRLSRPNRSFSSGEPPAGSYEPVAFPSADGLRLSGWFLPSAGTRDGVVLCHGFQTGRREMLPLALALRDRGHHVLLFDFRSHGESEGRWTSCGLLETLDLEGAVRHLLSRPEVEGGRIGVLGFSMGGAVALLTAARMPEIRAVVADSSFATLKEVAAVALGSLYRLPRFPVVALALWFSERLVGVQADRIRPLDAVADLAPRPILLIHGIEDRTVPLSEAYLLYEAAGEPKELWTVAGADHVAARLIDFQGYLDRVDGFFKGQLAPVKIA